MLSSLAPEIPRLFEEWLDIVSYDEVLQCFPKFTNFHMKYQVMLLLLSFAASAVAQKNKSYNLLVGTYTQSGKSEGIYVYTFNTLSGELTAKSKAVGVEN